MRLGDTWSSLRGPLRERFKFSDIKEIVGAAGVPIHILGHVQQRSGGGATKSQLLDEIDVLFRDEAPQDQDRIVVASIRSMVQRTFDSDKQSELIRELSELLGPIGWGVAPNGEPFPLSLQIGADTASLDDETSKALTKCLRRFRDGDLDGALSAICGAVDTITEHVFLKLPSLGDHRKTPYAVRIRNAFRTHEATFKNQLSNTVFSADEIDQLWHHQFKSVEQSGEVLAKLRQLSDVHGAKSPSVAVVQRGIDCAVYLTRIFAALTEE